jgi:hypothetical protein
MRNRCWIGADPYTIVGYILHRNKVAEKTEGIDRKNENTNPEPQDRPVQKYAIGLRTVPAQP